MCIRDSTYPFVSLLVSGGHTQIILIKSYDKMKIIGETRDDAVGEAFDKCAKILGLDYPGGPLIDKLSYDGNKKAYSFPDTNVDGYDYSFSGIKTSFLYFINKELKNNPDFIKENLNDICASIPVSYTHLTLPTILLV